MEVIRFLFGSGSPHRGEAHAVVRLRCEVHSLKSGESEALAIERGDPVNADPKKAVRPRLVERNHAWINFDQLQKKILVAYPGKLFFLLIRRKSRKVIDLRFLQTDDVFLYGGTQGRLREELRPGDCALSAERCGSADNQAIRAERFFVEEVCCFQALVHFDVIISFFEFCGFDSEFRQQTSCLGAIGKW